MVVAGEGVPARVRCSTVSRGLGESLAGTAPARADRWLLVEHPGPWSPKPLDSLSGPARDALDRAERLGIRVQLIRRPGRGRSTGPRQVYLARTSGPAPWVAGVELDDLAQLATLDLDALAAGQPPGGERPEGPMPGGERPEGPTPGGERQGGPTPGGERPGGPTPGEAEPVTGPLYLVCTHGRRDACCAEFGRPVAAAVATAFPGRVWETTHLGGHRFAATMVCLPHGVCLGRLDAESGPAAAAAYARGEIDLDRYRGRAGTPEAVQVAEHHARRHLGARGLTAITVESVSAEGPRTTAVLAAGDGRVRVVVESAEAAERRALTCGADATCPPVHRVSLAEVATSSQLTAAAEA